MLLANSFAVPKSRALEVEVAVHPSTYVDADTGIPDLVRRLAEDSRRLAGDEVRLAKLELHESVHAGAAGSIRLAVAAGFAVIAAVALTVLLVSVVSPLLGHYWAGALIVGVIELGAGLFMLRRGVGIVKAPSYTLRESRESLKDTAAWVRRPDGAAAIAAGSGAAAINSPEGAAALSHSRPGGAAAISHQPSAISSNRATEP